MTRARPRHPMRRLDDTGAGLVEAMVAVVIFTVVTGLLTGFVIDMLRTSAAANNRLTNVDQLRVAMDEMSKGLRIAVRPEQIVDPCTGACEVSLFAPAANAVSFYANQGAAGQARLTTYRAEPDLPGTGRLVAEHHTAGTPVALATLASTDGLACDGCTSRTLVRGLVWPVPVPVFTYAAGDCTGAFAAPPTGPTGPPVALADDTACVAIDLRVAGARDNAGTSVTSTVFLPNSVIGR